MLSPTENTVRFGLFELDLRTRQLTKNGVTIRLPQQPIQVLSLLLERPGEIVTREELRRRLWPSDVFVDFDHGLNKSIQKLRDALGDSAASPRYIETIPRIGYRFIGPSNGATAVLELTSGTNVLQPQNLVSAPPGQFAGSRRVRWLLIAAWIALGALTAGWLIHSRLRASESIQSLAVLPLDNLSGDSSQDYFADGMTDELITMLAKDSTLRVVSRTSVMQYRGARRPLPEIARALHADAILEGSVSRSANQVHMTLQLIRADTDSHLWADSYQRDANDVGLPDEAAKAIAKQLHRAVPAVKAIRYVNPAAHDAYLHGNYLWFGERMEESGPWFRKAIDLQPDYALAWAGLADYYGEGIAGDVLDPRISIVPEEQAAERALELDPNLPQAHQAMGAMFLIDRWDWADADREILRAISLDPQNSELYYLRACVLQADNRNAEAIDLGKKAMEIDPFLRPYVLASIYEGARQFDAALAEIRLRLEANPNNLDLLGTEMDTLRRMGNYKEAVDVWARWHILMGDPQSAASLRRAWDRNGARGFVRWQLGRRLLQSKRIYISPVELASYYAQLGDKERALALLEEGYRQHSTDTLWIQEDPAYDFLHADPRFRSIVLKTGVPPAY
ncbi:MAG TPA: winged helix-turn-helix domain-containing protein [Acidobacteriaceae bacterium]|nr:winged helix-turn-helix domain-containing protein [Acidobacteriaceae bacterium]